MYFLLASKYTYPSYQISKDGIIYIFDLKDVNKKSKQIKIKY
ncbi:hypothetical protein ANASTE_00319 [Anaerofustis stercorihominis DSM 17244]|uniref:Uncharacterized protein n=1 Tax=Anaerofustis stercorihominis DSM 17244 TaxID=445971 RepID=B1C6H9_9FIRM|nr:hypothetical protein ANASTE_00319 [Anaerofustis stercorihominis DSM 17244]